MTIPPPMPLFPGKPHVVQPVPGGLVETGGSHDRERVPAGVRVDHSLAGERVDAAVSERGAHDGEIPGGDVQAGLARVAVRGLGRIAMNPAVALQQAGDALVAAVGLGRRAVRLVVEGELAPGEAGEAVADVLPPRVRVRAGDEACRRDRARVHHRVRSPVRAQFDRCQRVEREACAVGTKQAAGLVRPQALADEREDERLRNAHDRELDLRIPDREDGAVRRHDADAEQVRRHPRERRIDLRNRSVVGRPIALVRLGHEPAGEIGRWKLPRGDVRRIPRIMRVTRLRGHPASRSGSRCGSRPEHASGRSRGSRRRA